LTDIDQIPAEMISRRQCIMFWDPQNINSI
jgi:hypothetical protein